MKKKTQQFKILITIVILVTMFLPVLSFSHSGRTDSSGGHRDNKNKSGLGSYHYHCGGYPAHLHDGGVCPYNSTPKQTVTTSSKSSSSSSSSQSTSSAPKETKPKTISAKSIAIAKLEKEVFIGDEIVLDATILPENTTNKKITWTSNDEELATVTEDGKVICKAVGTVEITSKTSNGKQDTLEIIIKPIAVTEIKLDREKIILKPEEIANLIATVLPENATDKTVEWDTLDENIATVDENGKVTAIASGTTKITCTNKDGIKTEAEIVIEEIPIPVVENVVDNNIVDDLIEPTSATPSDDGDAATGVIALGCIAGGTYYLNKKKKGKK